MAAQCPPVVDLEERVGRGPEEPPREYEEDTEAAARSRRALERLTRGAKAVAEELLDRKAVLFLPLSLQRSRQNTLAWTRTTRNGARSLLVDSMACAVAVSVFDEVGVEEDDAEAAA